MLVTRSSANQLKKAKVVAVSNSKQLLWAQLLPIRTVMPADAQAASRCKSGVDVICSQKGKHLD